MRLRLALLAAFASLSFGAVAVPAASAAPPAKPQASIAPALKTVKVAGKSKNGKTFSGTYAIQGYLARHGREYAVGTLTGRFKDHKVTRYNVLMPAKLTGASSSSGKAAARDQTTATCTVLHLVLAPITLNLLGLDVTLGGGTAMNQPIVLDITANPAQGLLGQLLCGLTNTLGGQLGGLLGQLNGNLNQLSGLLTAITGLVGAL